MVRIAIRPEAGSTLRTFSPHLLQQVGRALAEVAEFTPAGNAARVNRMDVWGCTVHYEVSEDTLSVLGIDSSDAQAGAAA